MTDKPDHSIAGTWRGHYSYRERPDDGSAFDAVFQVDPGGVLGGDIRDDEELGQASVFGIFSYPKVTFTKVYVFQGLTPIEYQGTMSGDGKTISGTWMIVSGSLVADQGRWMAHRTSEEPGEAETRQAEKTVEKTQSVF